MKKLFFVLFFISTFVFAQGGTECKVNVTSPKDGDTWYVGNTYDLKWNSTYCPEYFVYIKLFGWKNGKENLIDTLTSVKNDGILSFTPKQSAAGFEYCYFKFYAEGGGGQPDLRIPYVAGKSGNFYILETQQEDFTLFPQSMTFLLEKGSSSTQNFYIIPRKEVVNFTISSEQSWLNIQPLSGTAYLGEDPAKINVTAYSTGLQAGEYEGQILVSSSTREYSSTISVYLSIVEQSGGTPKLELDDNKVHFNYKLGQDPGTYHLTLKNVGDGEAHFIIDRFSKILSISPLKGNLPPGQSIKLNISLSESFNTVSTRKGFARIKDQLGNALYIFCFVNTATDSYNSSWNSSGVPSKTIPIAATGLGGAFGSFWSTDISGILMSSSFVQMLENIKKERKFIGYGLRDMAYLIWGAVGKKSRSQEATITEFEITDQFPSYYVDFLGNFMELESTSRFIQARGELANQIALFSRTYTTDSSGNTYGQFIGTPSEDQIIGTGGGKAIVFGLRNDENFRSNLFITELEGISTKVDVKLFNHNGELSGNVLTKTLEGFSQWQIIDIFNSAGTGANWAYAEIISYGGGRIYGFGSVIDKKTNDPTTLPGVIPSTTRTSGDLYLPAIVKAPGAYGTNWRTDLIFMNASLNSLNVEIEFYSKEGGTPEKKYITLLPISMGIYIDALKTLFGKDEGFGSIVVKNISTSNFFTYARIYNLKEDGSTYGQGTLAYKIEESTSINDVPVFSMGLESSQNFRSNVGVFEISGKQSRVLFTLIFPDGESRNFSITIDPYEWIQINNIIGRTGYDFDVANVWVVASVIEGSGKIICYTSLVDNNSSDAIFIKFIKP